MRRRNTRFSIGERVVTRPSPRGGSSIAGGRQIFRESSRSQDYEQAERLPMIRAGEIASGGFQGLTVEKTTIDELLDDVMLDYQVNGKSVRFARNAIKNHLRRYFGGRRAVSIGTSDANQYVAFRRSTEQGTRTYRGRLAKAKPIPIRPAANTTINRELAPLKHAFYLGLKHTPRKVASIPYIPLLEEQNVRTGFFEDPQFNRVIRLEAGTTQNDGARLLPMTNELYQVLAMQRSIRDLNYPDCPWVFFREEGRRVHSFRRAWATACKAAGLLDEGGGPGRLFHDLRRSGVRNLVRAGVPEAVAMRISGHRTLSVFERYNIVSERNLHDAARKLEGYLEEQRAQCGHNLGTIGRPEPDAQSAEDGKPLDLEGLLIRNGGRP